jgi:hypothetical protein
MNGGLRVAVFYLCERQVLADSVEKVAYLENV